jgi:hypothetical protein
MSIVKEHLTKTTIPRAVANSCERKGRKKIYHAASFKKCHVLKIFSKKHAFLYILVLQHFCFNPYWQDTFDS